MSVPSGPFRTPVQRNRRSIGLPNFYGDQVEEIVRAADNSPVVDQVDTHAHLQQHRL